MDTPKPAEPAVQPSRDRAVKPNTTTIGARYNRTVLNGIEAALRKNPEANLAEFLRPAAYTKKLNDWMARGMTLLLRPR